MQTGAAALLPLACVGMRAAWDGPRRLPRSLTHGDRLRLKVSSPADPALPVSFFPAAAALDARRFAPPATLTALPPADSIYAKWIRASSKAKTT